jgi:hypothetical protein
MKTITLSPYIERCIKKAATKVALAFFLSGLDTTEDMEKAIESYESGMPDWENYMVWEAFEQYPTSHVKELMDELYDSIVHEMLTALEEA